MKGAINAFLRATDMPWTKFGRLAVGDPRFVEDVRNGRRLRPATEAKVRAFMEQWPERSHRGDDGSAQHVRSNLLHGEGDRT